MGQCLASSPLSQPGQRLQGSGMLFLARIIINQAICIAVVFAAAVVVRLITFEKQRTKHRAAKNMIRMLK
jgi:hypothetical protein